MICAFTPAFLYGGDLAQQIRTIIDTLGTHGPLAGQDYVPLKWFP